ncbi:hypothetical protein V6x_42520 [Gimesia chilikensis]|uniref:Uncharacterized protein n=1 Tax=Gimesia chilikensis TaxID=2605989 RepID=A0A517WGZ2_9PLAN|nr:hypothetical protein [Gimesia chilikensis]QDU04524.1 hypothetical protein V6x_42520 [Gimesia chilikensis]
MTESVRSQVTPIIVWGAVAFLVINAFSWNPGWGGRRDREPGWELERYFGWPACYYCDLWRSDRPDEIDHPAYFPLIPFSRQMGYVYHSFSFTALALNLLLVVCGVVSIILWNLSKHDTGKSWMGPAGIALAILGIFIVLSGNEFSTYL